MDIHREAIGRPRESQSRDSGTGYYGLPVVKEPPWKWEIPLYFFVGGAAGAAAVIAGAGRACGANPKLVRDAARLAALGGLVSPALLISDLGRPSRFLNMLRVLKPQSPMSVGSWTLVVFSSSAAAAAVLGTGLVASASQAVSSLAGMGLSTYTGVLIGASAIPAWSENAALLPLHFAASGMGSAVAILQLAGHGADRGLASLGTAAAVVETLVGGRIEISRRPALRPLKSGSSGKLTRAGWLLSGPVPLLLRLLAGRSQSGGAVTMRRIAAASTVAGSVITRAAWLKAGAASARDPRVILR